MIELPTDYDERKKWQLWTFLTQYFPDAFLAVVDVAIKGNDQHNPGEPMHWARGKSMDQMNTAMRHMWDHTRGAPKDTDGAYHLAKAIWRLSAELQLVIEAEHEQLSKAEEKDTRPVAEVKRSPTGHPSWCWCSSCFRAIEEDARRRSESSDPYSR